MMNKPRVMPYLWQVHPVNMTIADREWLTKALESDYHKVTVDDVMDNAASGFMQIWRCGEEEGLIVTEVVKYNAALYLCADYLAMRDYFKKLDEIETCLVEYAKLQGCSGIILQAARRGLQRIYEKRYKELTRSYVREIL